MTPFAEDALESIQDTATDEEAKNDWLKFFNSAQFFDFNSDREEVLNRAREIRVHGTANLTPKITEGSYWLETSLHLGRTRIAFAAKVAGGHLSARVIAQKPDGTLGLMPVVSTILFTDLVPILMNLPIDEEAEDSVETHQGLLPILAALYEMTRERMK